MESSVEQTVNLIRDKIKELENEDDITMKPILLNQANTSIRKLENELIAMGQCYTKERLRKQLEVVKHRLKRIETEMMDEIRFQKIRFQRKGMGVSRLSIQKSKFGPEPQAYKYNPRQSIEQNVLRSIVWTEVTEGQLLLKNEELEDIARRMEANKDVTDQIHALVVAQGEHLDIIDSRIMTTHKNVVEANVAMDEANVLYGGKPRVVEASRESQRFDTKPSPIKKINSSEIHQTELQPQPEADSIVMNIRGKARGKARGFFGNIGQKVSQFFNNFFGKSK